jgi:hypothetical protein
MAGAALVVAGCGSGSDNGSVKPVKGKGNGEGANHAMMSANTGALVSIARPTQGQLVTANSVPTDVALRNFRIDCRFAGTPNRAGVGHYHLELDGSLINMFCGDRAAVSLQNVAPGRHELEVIPAENDHTDDMQAARKVPFVYRPAHALRTIAGRARAGRPSITILSPRSGAVVRGGFDLVVRQRNFVFSCDLFGKRNLAGYGHWHANVDSTSQGMMGMGTMLGMSCTDRFHVSLAGIRPGRHTFFAILEDNQHTPSPGAQAAVRVTVR